MSTNAMIELLTREAFQNDGCWTDFENLFSKNRISLKEDIEKAIEDSQSREKLISRIDKNQKIRDKSTSLEFYERQDTVGQ